MHIVAIILDLMHAHYFHCQLVSRIKISLFFGMGNSFSVFADKRKKDILVLGEAPIDGLDNISIIAEAKYLVNITKSRKKICLSILQCCQQLFV